MRRFIVISIAAALIAAIIALPVGGLAAPAGTLYCHETSVVPMADSGIQGQARLCANDYGIQADIDASNLTAGDAYTVWLVYFDRPAACATIPCGPPDTTGENPPGVLGRLDSLVAGDSGEAHFGGEIRGLRLSPGSAVHVPIFNHGAANTEDNRARARQLLTPQVPGLGAPGMALQADGRLGFAHAAAIFDIP